MHEFLDDCVILKVSRAKKINKLGKLGLTFSEFPWSLFFFLLVEDAKLHATQQGPFSCCKDVAHQHIQAQLVLAKPSYLRVTLLRVVLVSLPWYVTYKTQASFPRGQVFQRFYSRTHSVVGTVCFKVRDKRVLHFQACLVSCMWWHPSQVI